MAERLIRTATDGETSPIQVEERFSQKLALQNSFNEFFLKSGFIKLPTVSIISANIDPTVDFIGSSTNVFKDYLIDRENRPRRDIPKPGSFLYQPKIRTQNGNAFYTDKPIDLLTYFVGGGILMPPHSYKQICNITTEFLLSLGLKASDLTVKMFSGHPELIAFWKDKNSHDLPYELVTENENEYLWDYGEPGLTGRGVIFAVKSGADNKPKDFSTLTVINHFGKEVGVEWGFGSEVLLSNFYDLPHPISYSSISEVNPYILEQQDGVKLADTLTACVSMLDAGLSYEKKDRARGSNVLIKYMKALSYYLREANTPTNTLERWTHFLISKEFNRNPKTFDLIINYIKKTQEIENNFASAMAKAITGNFLPLESFEGVKKMRRENQKIDVIKLALKYYNHFESSKFYKSTKNNLIEGMFLF